MNALSIEERVNSLKKNFKEFGRHPEHTCATTAVSASEIKRLQLLDGFPPDMLLVLSEIGTMKWSFRGCSSINWWIPCKIEVAMNNDRCYYEICEENLVNGGDPLVFADDCHALVYFYDTSARPWRLLSTDGLDLHYNQDNRDAAFIPEPEARDVIAILESWVENCLSARPLKDFENLSDELFG